MMWFEQVFNYCERGLNPALWAEPFNAVSNAAFVVVAAAAGTSLWRSGGKQPSRRGERLALWCLVGLVGVIGIGSFLFHTFATRWAMLADVLPITLFMVSYLAFALRVFMNAGWLTIALTLPLFLAAGSLVSDIVCPPGRLMAATAAAHEPCFNGSLGYAPALVALVLIGALAARRHASGRILLMAAAVFLVSMVLRTVDQAVCNATELFGKVRGTHALWHLLNATTLYLLLSAGIRGIGGSHSDSSTADR